MEKFIDNRICVNTVFPVEGSDWSNVEFLDQTEEEKNVYYCKRNDHDYIVRGKTYLEDGKKIHTGPAVFRFVMSEFIGIDEDVEDGRLDHIAAKGRIKKRIEAIQSIDEPPEILVTNFQYPGSPPISQVSIFVACPSIRQISESDSDETKSYKRMWQQFTDIPIDDDQARLKYFEGTSPGSSWSSWISDVTWAQKDDLGVYPLSDFRNKRFKVIPRLVEGPWVAQTVMPSNIPCLLGQKVQMRYFRGSGYMEIDVDIGSSAVACNIMAVIRRLSKSIKIEYAITLQGEADDELPEKVFVCQGGDRPDFDHFKSIDLA